MLTPGNINVNQQKQKADKEKWVVGAVMQAPLKVMEAENDKLVSVVLHGEDKTKGKHST